MSNLKKLSVVTAGALVIALATGIAEKAVAQTLTFEGVGLDDGFDNPVGSFYNGVGGPDFNIVFSPEALAVIDSDADGVPGVQVTNPNDDSADFYGNFSNEPSPPPPVTPSTPGTILAFDDSPVTTTSITMNAVDGAVFVDSLSFRYVSAFIPDQNGRFQPTVTAFSGPNGTGTPVGSSGPLPLTPQGVGDPSGGAYDFSTSPNPVSVTLTSPAQSVVFNSPFNNNDPDTGGVSLFDNITVTAVPEPSSVLGLLTFGAFGAGVMLKRKRAKRQN